jgi:hypothetical protein
VEHTDALIDTDGYEPPEDHVDEQASGSKPMTQGGGGGGSPKDASVLDADDAWGGDSVEPKEKSGGGGGNGGPEAEGVAGGRTGGLVDAAPSSHGRGHELSQGSQGGKVLFPSVLVCLCLLPSVFVWRVCLCLFLLVRGHKVSQAKGRRECVFGF